MENKILTVDRYVDRIRSKMGVSETYLPDEDINMPDIIDVAELNITSLFPDYEDFEGNNIVYLESITVLECCILLCPSMSARLPKKQSGPHAGHELYINWDKKKEDFINERDSLIGRLEDLLNPGTNIYDFKNFIVTYPKRGW